MSKPDFTVDHTGHLVVAGRAPRTIALRFESSGAGVLLPAYPDLLLPWERYGSVRWIMDGPAQDGWLVVAFVDGRAPAGIGVQVSGTFAVASHELFAATMTRWRRYHHWWGSGTWTGHTLPLIPDVLHATCAKERATVRALIGVLTARPELRDRLGDSDRMTRLARDLAARPLGVVYERTGMTRDALDIVHAMHRAGFVHRFGRPLPGDVLAPLAEVVSRTQQQLATNPYRQGRHTDDRIVEKYVRRNYTDVEAWPFDGLMI